MNGQWYLAGGGAAREKWVSSGFARGALGQTGAMSPAQRTNPPARARLASLLLLLAACGQATAPTPPTATAPQRIVLTNAAAVDIVADLVGLQDVVAIPAGFDDYVNVGGLEAFGADRRFDEFNAEVILGLNPDYVVAGSWTAADSVAHLRQAGVDVYLMPTVNTLDDVRATIRAIGTRLQADAQTDALLQDFDARVAALRTAAAARTSEVTALSYTNYGSGGWTAGAGTTADMIIDLAGARNVAAAAGRTGHDLVDFETLFTWDADWIVVSTPSSDYGMTRAYLENEAALADLRAIRAGQIAEVPSDLYSTTSHYLVEAAEELSAIFFAPSE